MLQVRHATGSVGALTVEGRELRFGCALAWLASRLQGLQSTPFADGLGATLELRARWIEARLTAAQVTQVRDQIWRLLTRRRASRCAEATRRALQRQAVHSLARPPPPAPSHRLRRSAVTMSVGDLPVHTIGRTDTSTSTTAIGLCLSSPVAWSMTPRQLAIFKQFCALQMADAGVHSLLPTVMADLLALARRPWWDRGVAELPHEPFPGLPA